VNQFVKKVPLICLFLFASAGAGFADERTDADAKSKPKGICAVSCVEPIATSDADGVIDVLKATTKALADHDFTALASHLDVNCTTYNESTHKLVVGRDAIIKDVKANVEAEERKLKVPPISFTIDHPYAMVTGDQAVVTFVLIKEIGGANPVKFASHTSDVFIKRDGQWKKLHFCGGGWKKMKEAT
jgi:hypothetical protein